MNFLAEVDTTGIQNLILEFFKMLSEVNFKEIDLDFLGTILTVIAPVWNPIWAYVNTLLEEWFGFV